jgi:hypothetical protein
LQLKRFFEKKIRDDGIHYRNELRRLQWKSQSHRAIHLHSPTTGDRIGGRARNAARKTPVIIGLSALSTVFLLLLLLLHARRRWPCMSARRCP